jgi:hypothetical protein
MPKTVPCPTCRAEVKVPRDAEPGTELTCPECDETFVPPHLRPKAYDPHEEEGYAVGRVVPDRDRAEKRRKAKAMVAQARRNRRDDRRLSSSSPGAVGGIEAVLLVIAAVTAVAFPVGYVIAKRFPSTGEMVLIGAAYIGLLLVFVGRILRAKARLGG